MERSFPGRPGESAGLVLGQPARSGGVLDGGVLIGEIGGCGGRWAPVVPWVPEGGYGQETAGEASAGLGSGRVGSRGSVDGLAATSEVWRRYRRDLDAYGDDRGAACHYNMEGVAERGVERGRPGTGRWGCGGTGRALGQALGVSGEARPADAVFRVPVPEKEPELVCWRSDGGSEHGTLRDVAGYYRSLDRGRMVILGDAGAGKTVLATQLVIDLISKPPEEGELRPGRRPPVPVWITLASVDMGEAESLARVSAEELADRLDRQMAAQISAACSIPRSTGEELIRKRWVLPVLDGLDEMDVPGPEGSGWVRSRAAAVVRALNDGTGRRPVVLICRREHMASWRDLPAPGQRTQCYKTRVRSC